MIFRFDEYRQELKTGNTQAFKVKGHATIVQKVGQSNGVWHI